MGGQGIGPHFYILPGPVSGGQVTSVSFEITVRARITLLQSALSTGLSPSKLSSVWYNVEKDSELTSSVARLEMSMKGYRTPSWFRMKGFRKKGQAQSNSPKVGKSGKKHSK